MILLIIYCILIHQVINAQLEYLNNSNSSLTTQHYLGYGNVIDQFDFRDRIDYLGYEKQYFRDDDLEYESENLDVLENNNDNDDDDDNSHNSLYPLLEERPFGYHSNEDHSIITTATATNGILGNVDDKNDEAIQRLDDVHIMLNSSCIRNGTFCLHEHIFKGGHGDIFRSYRIHTDGRVHKDISYVLKRMSIKNKPHIQLCAEREIYFGHLLYGQPHMPRFVQYFRTDDEYWLVYRDEGISLQQLFYAMTVDQKNVMLRPSNVWKNFRVTDIGKQSMKSLMHQIIAQVYRLHQQGIIHRDLKLSNILLNTEEKNHPYLVINDFSSALNEEILGLGLYGLDGPTQQELTLDYAPPEVILHSRDNYYTYDSTHPESYDIWSIGIIFMEILLGTVKIFEMIDQRTIALITHRLRHHRKDTNYEELLKNTLYMAALSEFCIIPPSSASSSASSSSPSSSSSSSSSYNSASTTIVSSVNIHSSNLSLSITSSTYSYDVSEENTEISPHHPRRPCKCKKVIPDASSDDNAGNTGSDSSKDSSNNDVIMSSTSSPPTLTKTVTSHDDTQSSDIRIHSSFDSNGTCDTPTDEECTCRCSDNTYENESGNKSLLCREKDLNDQKLLSYEPHIYHIQTILDPLLKSPFTTTTTTISSSFPTTSTASGLNISNTRSNNGHTCTIHHLYRALLKRDPLSIGFSDKWGLELIMKLLQFEPSHRISLSEALDHAYFVGPYISSIDQSEHATMRDRYKYEEELIRKNGHMSEYSRNMTSTVIRKTDILTSKKTANLTVTSLKGKISKRIPMPSTTPAPTDDKFHPTTTTVTTNNALTSDIYSIVPKEDQQQPSTVQKQPLAYISEWLDLVFSDDGYELDTAINTMEIQDASLIINFVDDISDKSVHEDLSCTVKNDDLRLGYEDNLNKDGDIAEISELHECDDHEDDHDVFSSDLEPNDDVQDKDEDNYDYGSTDVNEGDVKNEYKCRTTHLLPESSTSSSFSSISSSTLPLLSDNHITVYNCPSCHRKFASYSSCMQHLTMRNHGQRCLLNYTASELPNSCLSEHRFTLQDIHSGWCDLQGKRSYIEDYHAIKYDELFGYVFYGVYDGHTGSRAARFTSRHLHHIFHQHLIRIIDKKTSARKCHYSFNSDGHSHRETSILSQAYVDYSQNETILHLLNDHTSKSYSDVILLSSLEDIVLSYSPTMNAISNESDTDIINVSSNNNTHQFIGDGYGTFQISSTNITLNGNDMIQALFQAYIDTDSYFYNITHRQYKRKYLSKKRELKKSLTKSVVTKNHTLSSVNNSTTTTTTTNTTNINGNDKETLTNDMAHLEKSGSTAVTAIVTPHHILIGNVGDSRIVMCCDMDGLPITLTMDHTAENDVEALRIIDMGGSISYTSSTSNVRDKGIDQGESDLSTSNKHVHTKSSHTTSIQNIARVDGVLAVTRSIGDHQYRPYVTATPDILLMNRIITKLQWQQIVYNKHSPMSQSDLSQQSTSLGRYSTERNGTIKVTRKEWLLDTSLRPNDVKSDKVNKDGPRTSTGSSISNSSTKSICSKYHMILEYYNLYPIPQHTAYHSIKIVDNHTENTGNSRHFTNGQQSSHNTNTNSSVNDNDVYIYHPQHLFLIIASDGTWDVMSADDAIDIICTHLYTTLSTYLTVITQADSDTHDSESNRDRYHRASSHRYSRQAKAYITKLLKKYLENTASTMYQEAARLITYEAYARGSNDNIGTCVVNLVQ